MRYSIVPEDGLLTIDVNNGTITIQKDIPLGTLNQYTITLKKLGYKTKTTTVWVYRSVSTSSASFLEIFIQEYLSNVKTNRFIVRWNNGAIDDGTIPSDIFYRIHYAWTAAKGAIEDPTTLNKLQAMSNYRVKEISGENPSPMMATRKTRDNVTWGWNGSNPLPVMATVKQYMGVDKKVYVLCTGNNQG